MIPSKWVRQDLAMRLDHISYACSTNEIADVVQRIGSDLGVTFVDGGRHPSFGTRNFTGALSDGSYIEVVSALDHPAALKAPFGQAVHRRAEEGGGWLSWVISVDSIDGCEKRIGRSAAAGHRVRPDGVDLRWKQLGVLDTMERPWLPFFVEWDVPADVHPGAEPSAVSVRTLELSGNSDEVDELLAGLGAIEFDVEWQNDEDPGLLAVWFTTPAGPVRVD